MLRAFRHLLYATAHGCRIATVAGEIEGDRDKSIARECNGQRMHELLRTRKAMRNHEDRALTGGLVLEYCQGDVSRDSTFDDQVPTGRRQGQQAQADHAKCKQYREITQ